MMTGIDYANGKDKTATLITHKWEGNPIYSELPDHIKETIERIEGLKKAAEKQFINKPTHCKICGKDFITNEHDTRVSFEMNPDAPPYNTLVVKFVCFPVCPHCRSVKLPYVVSNPANT